MTAYARRLDIDNLRNAAVLLLVPFHAARLFDNQRWHIKDADTYPAADFLVRLLGQWHMPLLFLLAGMSAWYAMARISGGDFVRERVTRLFIPLVFGIFLFVLPQVWLERIAHGAPGRDSPIDFSGTFLEFLPTFFQCCYPKGNFSWHHLWFVFYLFVYSLALAPAFVLLRGRAAAIAPRFGNPALLLALGLPVLVAELLLRRHFPSTHAFADDWANNAHYVLLMAIGWLMAASPAASVTLKRHAWPLAIAAVLAIVSWFATPRGPMYLAVREIGEWLALLALLGLGARMLDRPIAGLTAFTRYAFPFYIVHQAVIVALGYFWLGWSGQPLLKFVAVAAVATAGSLAVVRLFDANSVTRFVIGLKPPRGARLPAESSSRSAEAGLTDRQPRA